MLRDALQTVHPGLHRYLTPAEYARELARLERALDSTATIPEAYLALAAFTSRIRDGHTFPNPANQSRAVADRVFRATRRVPFYFRWLDGRMVVTRDASGEGAFPAGTEVLAVNGISTREILGRLLPYTRTDGANAAKRVANLELRPAERWQAFDVLYALVFPSRPGAPWTFRVRAPGGRIRSVVAPPADAAQRMAVYDSIRGTARAANAPPWTLRVDSDCLAVMTMPTWVTYNDSWDWTGWVDRAFAELAEKGATALVVDLRGNEGGTGVGDRILAHLVTRETVVGGLRQYVRYDTLPARLRPHLDTWDRSFDDWRASTRPAPEKPGFLRLVRDAEDSSGTVVAPVAPRYTGRVFVLVGAENSSATFEFARAVRERKLGTLVGQPTGGNQRGINGGAFYFLRLPNSRLEVDLPVIGFYATEARPDAGIEPDVLVRVTAADVAAGRDPEMDAVRRARDDVGRCR